MRTLVIGKKLENIKDSLSWDECSKNVPVVGDYDKVILVLPTLTSEVLDRISYYFMDKLKSKIIDALYAEKMLYCITAPLVEVGVHNNYEMFPFELSIKDEKGKSLKPIADLSPYLLRLKKWDYCFFKSVLSIREYDSIKWEFTPILETGHKYAISFGVLWKTEEFSKLGQVLFVPPLEGDIDVSILSLIQEGQEKLEEETYLPDFLDDEPLEGEKDLQTQFKNHKEQLEIAKKNLNNTDLKLKQLKFMKGILTLKDKSLVRAVKKVFKEMDLKLEGKEEFQEDKMLIVGKYKLPVEIKGHDKGASENDLLQAYGRIIKARVKDSSKVRGVLIINTYARLPLEDRKDDFNINIIKRANALNICLLSTRELYKFWNDFRATGKTSLSKEIFKTPGLLTFKKNNIDTV